MKVFSLLLATLFVTTSLVAQPAVWKVDRAHSNVTFAVDYMVLTEVQGSFKEFDATMMTEGEDLKDASVKVTIMTASIYTENEKRDAHLRAPDFFDAEKHPEITFVSKSFENVEGDRYRIIGDLTMRGVTKPVELDARYVGQARDPRGNTRAGFRGMTTINRNGFGVKYNSRLADGGWLIGENVAVTVNVQFIRQQGQASTAK